MAITEDDLAQWWAALTDDEQRQLQEPGALRAPLDPNVGALLGRFDNQIWASYEADPLDEYASHELRVFVRSKSA